MAIIHNTAEAGVAPGTAITSTAQTGGTAGTAFDDMTTLNANAGGVSFSDEHTAHGGLSYRLGYGSSSTLNRRLQWTGRLSDRIALRWYNLTEALPPVGSVDIGEVWLASPDRPTSGYGVLFKLRRQADGSVEFLRKGDLVVFTTPPLSAGVMYRFEVRAKYASAPGVPNGHEEFAVYVGDSPEPLPGAYWLDTAVDNRADTDRLPGGIVRVGSTSTNGQSFYERFEFYDDLAYATDADADRMIGPVLPRPGSTVRPFFVTANPGQWFPTGGDDLVEVVSDDEALTFAESPGVEDGEALTYALPPLTSGALRVVTRAARGASATAMTVEILQGATTVVASRTFTLAADAADYEVSCTSAELAKVTDRSRLRVRITGGAA